MKDRHGFLPTAEEELLLKACLLQGEEAQLCWRGLARQGGHRRCRSRVATPASVALRQSSPSASPIRHAAEKAVFFLQERFWVRLARAFPLHAIFLPRVCPDEPGGVAPASL